MSWIPLHSLLGDDVWKRYILLAAWWILLALASHGAMELFFHKSIKSLSQKSFSLGVGIRLLGFWPIASILSSFGLMAGIYTPLWMGAIMLLLALFGLFRYKELGEYSTPFFKRLLISPLFAFPLLLCLTLGGLVMMHTLAPTAGTDAYRDHYFIAQLYARHGTYFLETFPKK